MSAGDSKGVGLDFQREVFELVAERLRRQYRDASLIVSNYDRGPIDIVANLTRTALSISEDPVQVAERIYIECKQRSRKIDMDAAGKTFCRAVIDRPDFLIIVSDTVLAPETVECALQLFSCYNATQVVINRSHSPVTSTKFLHYTLDELRGRPRPASSAVSNDVLENHTFEVGWTLIEADACGAEKSICGSARPKAVYAVRLDATYVLRVIVSLLGTSVPRRLPEISFTDDTGARLTSLIPQHIRQVETFFTADFPVPDPGALKAVTSLTICLGSKGDHKVPVQFPRLLLTDDQPLLGDFRASLIDDLVTKTLSGTSVLLVGGGGGLGKSYLAEGLCRKLAEHGYSTRSHIWREDDDDSVFYQLVLPQFFDQEGMGKQVFQELAASYVASLSDRPGTEAESLRNPNLLATAAVVCARALGQSPQKLVWSLQNCHEMSPAMVGAVRMFIQQCRSLCPDARFILEYRDDEAGPAWRELVAELQTNHYLGAALIPLAPIDYRLLHDAVTRTVVGIEVGEFARVLLAKTAGNPLFIESLLRYWMRLSYVVVRETSVGRKLHIESFAAIKAEVDGLPDDVRAFLVLRLEQLLTAHTNKEELAAVLYIGSLMPRPPSIEVLARAGSTSVADLGGLLRDWVSEDILRPSSDGASMAFSHEFFRLAAQKAACQHTSRDVKERVMAAIDKTSGWECILVGRMHLGLGDSLGARDWFSRAIDLLSEDYVLLRMALAGTHDALKRIDPTGLQDRTGRVEVLLDLGWAESQGGRVVDARRTFASSLDEVAQLFDPHNDEHWRIARHLRASIYHRLVTVEIEMALLASALDNFEYAMREVADAATLYHLSNRLVLSAELIGCTQEGWRASDISLKLADLVNATDTRAVIRSDVGRLYFFASPSTALILWQEGLVAAEAPRQRTHAQADVFAARLACGEDVAEAEIIALRECVKDRVPAQVPRLEMLIAACRFASGDLEGAAQAFGRAAGLASMSGQLALRAGSLVNLGLVNRLLRCDSSDPSPLYEAQACLAPFFDYDEGLPQRLSKNLSVLEGAFSRLTHAAEIKNPHPSLPLVPPVATSAMVQMVATLHRIGLDLTPSDDGIADSHIAHLRHCGFAASLRFPDGVPLIIL